MQSELNVIADAIDSVQEAATADVEPTANPVPLETYLRPDVPVTPLPQSEVPAAAPATADGMFVAPQILGEEGHHRYHSTRQTVRRADGGEAARQGDHEP